MKGQKGENLPFLFQTSNLIGLEVQFLYIIRLEVQTYRDEGHDTIKPDFSLINL